MSHTRTAIIATLTLNAILMLTACGGTGSEGSGGDNITQRAAADTDRANETSTNNDIIPKMPECNSGEIVPKVPSCGDEEIIPKLPDAQRCPDGKICLYEGRNSAVRCTLLLR